MLDQQHRHAQIPNPDNQLVERLDLARAQPRRRLVEQQQDRMGDQGTGNLHEALMAECESAGTDERITGVTDDLERGQRARLSRPTT